jgi:hypothetical protein
MRSEKREAGGGKRGRRDRGSGTGDPARRRCGATKAADLRKALDPPLQAVMLYE